MSTWRPPLGGAGQFAVTLLPPTRASNSVTTSQPSPNHRTQHHTRGGPGRRHPTRRDHSEPDHSEPDRQGMARPSSGCPAWAGEQCKHGCADAQWQTPRRRRRTDGARLRRNPNLRRGRLHRPALSVQPRSALRAAPRVGPAEGDTAAATPPLLGCRGPMASSTRSLACLRASASKATVVVNAPVGCWVPWPGSSSAHTVRSRQVDQRELSNPSMPATPRSRSTRHRPCRT
jgi:hypothetical protein